MMPEPPDFSSAWDSSYLRRENHVFYPCEEMVRFVARFLRRRVGLDEVVDILPGAGGSRVLDVGCGMGRNLIFGSEMGLEMYGNDLSAEAVAIAQRWLRRQVGAVAGERVVASDVRRLPWETGFFAHALSDSALDSMPFAVAQAGVSEIGRVVAPGGYFYCNLISGDVTGRSPDFCGDVTVETEFERNTIQSYFSEPRIVALLSPVFELLSCELHQVNDALSGKRHGRWHVIGRRRPR